MRRAQKYSGDSTSDVSWGIRSQLRGGISRANFFFFQGIEPPGWRSANTTAVLDGALANSLGKDSLKNRVYRLSDFFL